MHIHDKQGLAALILAAAQGLEPLTSIEQHHTVFGAKQLGHRCCRCNKLIDSAERFCKECI